ncbi:hypothetical protein Rhopal_000679-T1 [Rhodotorula paludigena]|uniref:Stress-response A/B barrel domain-containing protein n=1 Tax=Rhodotorula paludigena TaxID=86838 RepID=A0AAV5GEF9_9BASI|nr:hypothetical protein Rhopal_000679-T1 [Rhodotorula paludigena]
MSRPIVHIVMWKFNGQQPADYLSTLRAAAQAMVGKIDGLKRVELGPPLESTKARSQGWEAMLYSELESEEALLKYAPHPVHEEFKTNTKPYATDIMAFDLAI